jgi:hypothetical protein
MRTSFARFVTWTPRLLGLLAAGFIGIFALDAFGPGKSLGSALLDFAIHLIPAMFLLLTVLAAWRRPWIGAIVFGAAAVAYAASVPARPDWILAISGPLLGVGLLFLGAWRHQYVHH